MIQAVSPAPHAAVVEPNVALSQDTNVVHTRKRGR